ncbi:polysaccharide deacetylase family protein [Desulfosporosinus hippei]|uniref:Peptidoglycan/xylan/chitin deacetylase, PgdA/CDA1 family n=1 Tax=Desulfosporosinus hippei DSM 8344 TaxID=1121419 RepID=A0A1G7UR64_9FIRM|nr:polysaccharide deacetylase family protein [Desulfosporosinus hippei]SDG49838.1 Peptidoglycan/xylan/chitin deacetylase, PgdA/CDA1 family [Desulfosporosinus hippei DSM 8344]
MLIKHWRIWRVPLIALMLLTSIYLSGCQSEKLIKETVSLSETPEVPPNTDITNKKEEISTPKPPQAEDDPKTEPSSDPKASPVPDKKSDEKPNLLPPEKSPANTPIHPFYGLDGTPPSAPGLAMRLRDFNAEPEKIVYLTFDDGPYPETTPRILKILQEEEIKATFFVLGRQVERYPELLKDEYTQGQGIGNHSYSHDYSLVYQSPDAFLAEIKQSEETIFKTIGVRPQIIRAPGGTQGHFSVNYYNLIDSEDYLVYDWNVSSGDAAAPTVPADQLVNNIKAQVPGKTRAIILMHDSKSKTTTIDALPRIVHYLKEQGYSFGVITPQVAPILFPGGFNH